MSEAVRLYAIPPDAPIVSAAGDALGASEAMAESVVEAPLEGLP